MNDLIEMQRKILTFRNARDWKQFNNPKDMAISLALEASEFLELFQWKSNDEIDNFVTSSKPEISEELVDTLYWVLLIAHDLEIDLKEAFNLKMDKNENKYSVEKAKGNHKKYTDL